MLFIHIMTAYALIVAVLYTDHLGLAWFRGKHRTLSHRRLAVLHRLIFGGLAIMITSGVFLFLPLRGYLLYTPAFYIKMGFVLTLIVNAFFIGRFMQVATEKPFADLTHKERLPLFISGAVSTIGWIGTIVAALNLGL